MKNVYTEKFTIDGTFINFNCVTPIYEIIKLSQRATFNHSNLIGLSHEEMEQRDNAFWIITKLKVFINDEIRSGDKLTLKTWTQEPSLVRFKRDFNIKQQGKLKVKGSAEWCCLDMTTHKIRKADSLNYPDLEMLEKTDIKPNWTNLKEEVSEKDYIYTYTVRSSDIDVNFHTNNLKYNFMTINAFTVAELKKLAIKEYELYFVSESHEGDDIKIYKKKIKNYYYVEGKCEDKTIFRTVIKAKNLV